jgi:conjugative transposon TraM protein
MNTLSPQAQQQRRLLSALPLLCLPFLTGLFWALGGGNGQTQPSTETPIGFNTELPSAQFKSERLPDKLGLYQRAGRDSAKRKEAGQNDAYFNLAPLPSRERSSPTVQAPSAISRDTLSSSKEAATVLSTTSFLSRKRPLNEAPETQIQRKLSQLQAVIDQPPTNFSGNPVRLRGRELTEGPPQASEDLDRLEKMMEMMNTPGETDPEMSQLEGMLEKILDIQHPERVKEKLREQSIQQGKRVFPVRATSPQATISLLETSGVGRFEGKMNKIDWDSSDVALETQPPIGFYGLRDKTTTDPATGNAVEAVVHDTQILTAGSTVRLRLLEDSYIGGHLIPKNQFVYGTCSLSDERLSISILSVRYGSSLLPVALRVYDLDGLPGLYVPGSITREAVGQSSDRTVSGLDLPSLDPSLGAQAAQAGVGLVKGLWSKKAKALRVTVKAGYRVLLKNEESTH